MQSYETEFESYRCETAQILLTLEDIQDRDRYLNIRNTILTLWEYGAVPIVNENDTVSFEEITLGDNDMLAAHLCIMIDADLLVLLSDIDGLYDRDPRGVEKAEIIRNVARISDDLVRSARGKGSTVSSGGIESKVRAAQIATRGGIGAVIANGKSVDLNRLLAGEELGTFFVPGKRRIRGKKKWIAFNPNVEGKIFIDSGGERAITNSRKSLLPAGITGIEGSFKMGSNVAILSETGREIARGLTNFSSDDLEKIKGLQSSKIAQVLAVANYFEEVVHRDNMVVLGD
jgi:glutamate 5-kinase